MENNKIQHGLEYALQILHNQAQQGKYPELALQENGGKGFQPINEALELVKKNTSSNAVVPPFLKTKYSLDELDNYIMELSSRTERHIHRGKLEDIEKLIRWRRRYDSINGA